MTGIAVRSRHVWRRLHTDVRRYGGRILYYGGVAAALTALAIAAERYRVMQPQQPAASVLPVVELSTHAEAGEEAPMLYAPEDAQLLRGYAAEPFWNATLAFWETHAALDCRMNDNAVASLSEGVVRAVGRSGTSGGFVEVETGEYLLRYASIVPDEHIAPGDALKVGDSIGIADTSLPGEVELGAHLHLELVKDGRYENFAELCADR